MKSLFGWTRILQGKFLLLFFSGFTPAVFLWQHDYTLYAPASAFLMVSLFSLIPVLVYLVGFKFIPAKHQNSYGLFVALLSFLYFSHYVLLKIIKIGLFQQNTMASILVLAVVGMILFKNVKQLIVIFLATMGAVNSANLLIAAYNNYSLDVAKQVIPVDTNLKFQKKPNVYFILLDGYSSFSQFDRLGLDSSKFKNFLTENQFNLYPDFLSNYFMTPDSMTSILSMGHHHYKSKRGLYETYGARGVIGKDNNVYRVFKANDYKVTLMHSSPRLTGNGCGDNRCILKTNIISRMRDRLLQLGLPWGSPPYRLDLLQAEYFSHVENKKKDQGYFDYVHIFGPGHTPVRWFDQCDESMAKKWYTEGVKASNKWMMPFIAKIIKEDPEGIIIVTADHGAFIMNNCGSKVSTDMNSLAAKHGTLMAVRAPNTNFFEYAGQMKTSVNIFTTVFDYLAQKQGALNLKPENSVYDFDIKRDKWAYKVFENGQFVKEKIQ